MNNTPMQSSRIPAELQAVFLASNRGEEVHKPPPGKTAFKVFRKAFKAPSFFRRSTKKEVQNSKSQTSDAQMSFMSQISTSTPTKSKRGKRRSFFKKQRSTTTNDSGSLSNASACSDPSEYDNASDGSKSPKSIMSHRDFDSENKLLLPLKEDSCLYATPQEKLDTILSSRGYPTKTYAALDTAYHNDPSPLQEASYAKHIVQIAKDGKVDHFRRLLKCGLSPNPSNYYGESIIHLVARTGQSDLLEVMLECGCDVQVADDYGRTPLHDACWAVEPSFRTVDMIIRKDIHLFQIEDSRGALPLSYVRKENYSAWFQFLEANKDIYWPVMKDKSKIPQAPVLVRMKSNTRPLSDPPNSLEIELARLVSAGKIEPEHALIIQEKSDDESDTESEIEEDEYSEEDSISDDEDLDTPIRMDDDIDEEDDDDDDNSSKYMDEDELNEMLQRIAVAKQNKKPVQFAMQKCISFGPTFFKEITLNGLGDAPVSLHGNSLHSNAPKPARRRSGSSD